MENLSDKSVVEYTASLWKNLKIPKSIPESHQQYHFKKIDVKYGIIYGARVRGKKHKNDGTNCDDWFEISNIDDWMLIAVADGAGSKIYSRIGAKIACKSSISYIRRKLKDIDCNVQNNLCANMDSDEFLNSCSVLASIVQNSFKYAYEQIEQKYTKYKNRAEFKTYAGRDLKFEDFASTLLLTLALPLKVDSNIEFFTISCQIGDGAIASIDANQQYSDCLRILSEADSGAFLGETNFLISPNAVKSENLMSKTKISRRKANFIVAMTDGVSDDYYPNNPEILRLYLDLKLNGMIDFKNRDKVEISKSSLNLIKDIPSAVSYPCIDNPSIDVKIQYASKIMSSSNLSLKQLWSNPDIIDIASIDMSDCILNKTKTVEESLKIWLDNYVERGSFDDRTIVIFKMGDV